MEFDQPLPPPDILRLMVLSVIADDYESFSIIAHETSEWAGAIGLAVNHEKIRGALEGLVVEGLAQAYVLSPHKPHSVLVPFSRELVWDHSYWITADGKHLLKTEQSEYGFLSSVFNSEKAAYSDFEILNDIVVNGFTLGKISDFEAELAETGDAFVVAPDGSRAGLVWRVSPDRYFDHVMGSAGKWGVWAVTFPYPMTTRDNARRNLESILPDLKREWEKWRLQIGPLSV